MEQMQIFNNTEFGSIRTITEDSNVLFCANEVARALGYEQPRNAVKRHCVSGGLRNVPHPQSSNKSIQMTFIPEGDVYRLIVHSKLPNAEKFERWMFDEVLPTIRKTGGYGKAPTDVDLITQIAVAVATTICTELVKQLAPLFQQPTAVKFQGEEMLLPNTCKLERAPKDLRERVDTMLRNMVEEQTLNFSAIARFCTMNGFTISSPSVKNYFDRMGMA